MAKGDGHGDLGNADEGERRKFCPFLGEYCIAERCALWMELFRSSVGGNGKRVVTKLGMCSIPALCEIMSSPRLEASPPSPKKPIIELPRGLNYG